MKITSFKKESVYVLAVLFYVVSIYLTWAKWLNSENEIARLTARNIVNTVDITIRRDEAIASLAGQYLNDACTESVIKELSRYAASSYTIRAVKLLKNGRTYCSSVSGSENTSHFDNLSLNKVGIFAVSYSGESAYAILYPYSLGHVSIELYKSTLDRIVTRYSDDRKLKITTSLQPLTGENVLKSDVFSYWVEVVPTREAAHFIASQWI